MKAVDSLESLDDYMPAEERRDISPTDPDDEDEDFQLPSNLSSLPSFYRSEKVMGKILQDVQDLHAASDVKVAVPQRELEILQRAFNKALRGNKPEHFSPLAVQVDALLKRLEHVQKQDPNFTTGDFDKKLKGGENWAPLRIPKRRRMQTLVVSCLLFFTGVPFALFLTVCSLCCWFTMPFMVAYLVYFFLIRRTVHPLPKKERWINGWWWTYYRDYFPVRLVIPQDVRDAFDKKRNYIFVYHPHGVHSFGAIVNFGTNVNGTTALLPGIIIHVQTLGINFKIPLWGEVFRPGGNGDASASCIRKTLAHGPGESVLIVVGGAEESLLSTPHQNSLTLSKRKGFVKIALETGSPLVPVFSFGETDTYGNLAEGRPWLQKLLKKIQKRVGFAIPLISGRGYFNYNFGPLPHRRTIVSVVGKPIDVPKIEKPTPEDVSKWHAVYVRALMELYDDNKEVYAVMNQDADLNIVN